MGAAQGFLRWDRASFLNVRFREEIPGAKKVGNVVDNRHRLAPHPARVRQIGSFLHRAKLQHSARSFSSSKPLIVLIISRPMQLAHETSMSDTGKSGKKRKSHDLAKDDYNTITCAKF